MSAPPALLRAQHEFASDTVWLNTATLGLPPQRVVGAVQDALGDWRSGRADPARFDEAVERARAGYAALVGVGADRVAIGNQASVLVGMVASSLPAGAEVLTARGEFTSVTFPFH
ncbi:MAG: aminotransferase, partial [Mycobacteriaceae bacterium]